MSSRIIVGLDWQICFTCNNFHPFLISANEPRHVVNRTLNNRHNGQVHIDPRGAEWFVPGGEFLIQFIPSPNDEWFQLFHSFRSTNYIGRTWNWTRDYKSWRSNSYSKVYKYTILNQYIRLNIAFLDGHRKVTQFATVGFCYWRMTAMYIFKYSHM